MPGKPKTRSWNDVQTAIATVAIVATLGLWNLFASPSRSAEAAQGSEPLPPPATEPPVEPEEAEVIPTRMPQAKIMFTQAAPQTTTIQQVQQAQPPARKKKKKNNDNGGGGGSVSVTQTKSS